MEYKQSVVACWRREEIYSYLNGIAASDRLWLADEEKKYTADVTLGRRRIGLWLADEEKKYTAKVRRPLYNYPLWLADEEKKYTAKDYKKLVKQ